MNKPLILSAIREQMRNNNIDVYIIPGSDPHGNEYLPAHWKIRQWVSGFTGSAGTIVITQKFAGLWTDSRYFIQAAQQLENKGIELVKLKIPHTPEYIEWILENINKQSKAGIDGSLLPLDFKQILASKLSTGLIELETNHDFISGIWTNRPAIPDNPVIFHDIEYTGISRSEKLQMLRNKMQLNNITHQIINTLDDIAWIFNIRGNDIEYNPLVIGYAAIEIHRAYLFINRTKFTINQLEILENEGIIVKNYSEIYEYLENLPLISRLSINPAKINSQLVSHIPYKLRLIEEPSYSTYFKGCKNITELKHYRQSMIKDGVALCNFWYWLENEADYENLNEMIIVSKILDFRKLQQNFMGASFGTIAAYNANAAGPHYEPSVEKHSKINKKGILLLDSGGQYLGGTTDITRVFALDEPTEIMKKHFSMVLKGMIEISMTEFLQGTKGCHLDILARKTLWQNGLNYGHGTGHGVGYFLNVHEGPHSISLATSGAATVPLDLGMVMSVEPGLYLEGEYGFRTENLVVVVPSQNTTFGNFYKFETLTLFPFDLELVDKNVLGTECTEWLNNYHANVFEKLSPYLPEKMQNWLKTKTKEI